MKRTTFAPISRFARVALSATALTGLILASTATAQEAAAPAAADPEATGPCADYAKKLCEKAGPATCQAIQMATDLMPANACETGMKDLDFSFSRIEEMKKLCVDLGDRLCKDLGEDTATCKMVRSKVPELAPEQCKGMVAQYAQVIADLQKQEAANKPLGDEDQAAIGGKAVGVFGPEKAKVTVVEFSDFQCPYCSRAATVTNQIKKKYPEGVRFVFRQFPLSFHKNAHLAAEAALAAGAEGKFWEYHDVLFQNQKQLDRASLEKYATDLGLDMAAFKKALDDGTYKQAVDDDIALGEKVAVRGTPTMFINGARVQNPSDIASISALIDAGLK